MDTWYEEIGRGIFIALLAGGTVKFLSDKDFSAWTFTPIGLGIFGLIALTYVKKKRNEK